MGKTIFIRNASQLITLMGSSPSPLIKEKMSNLGIIENGSVWIEDGIIQAVGQDNELAEKFAARIDQAEVVDAAGKLVTPGLVDPHTHLVFAGSRENEFNMRLGGATYMEIMNAGGGDSGSTKTDKKNPPE